MTQLSSKIETEVVFDRLPVLIGRSKICDLSLEDALSSRQHCVIESADSQSLRVVDLKSANGSLVNGEKVKEAPFRVGDSLQIGETVISLERVTRIQKEETTVHELEPWSPEDVPETTGTVLRTEDGNLLSVDELVEKEPEPEPEPSEVSAPAKEKALKIPPAEEVSAKAEPKEPSKAKESKQTQSTSGSKGAAAKRAQKKAKAEAPEEVVTEADEAPEVSVSGDDEMSFKTPSVFRPQAPASHLKAKDWVQVSLFWKNSLIDVQCFERGQIVKVGKGVENDFQVDLPSMPERISFLKILNEGIELNLGMPATGVVETRGKVRELDELRAFARQTDLGLSAQIPFRDRCLIEIGPFSFFIQSVRLRLAQALERPLVKEPLFSGVLVSVSVAFILFFTSIHQLQPSPVEPEELAEELILEIALPEEPQVRPPPPPPPPPRQPRARDGQRREQARRDVGAGGEGARASGAEGARGQETGRQQTEARSIGFETREAPPTRTPPRGAMGDQTRAQAQRGSRPAEGTGTARPRPEAQQQAPSPTPRPQVRVEEQGLLGVLGQSGGGGQARQGGRAEGRGLGGEIEGAVRGLEQGSTIDQRGSGGRGREGREFGGGGSEIEVGGLGTAGRGGGRAGFGLGSSGRDGEAEVSFVMEEVEVRDGLTREEIARVVRAHEHEIRACYDRALIQAGNREIAGRLEVAWFVNAQGRAVNIERQSAFGSDGGLFDCVAGRIRSWQFPRPRGGQGAQVTYPWLLRRGA